MHTAAALLHGKTRAGTHPLRSHIEVDRPLRDDPLPSHPRAPAIEHGVLEVNQNSWVETVV